MEMVFGTHTVTLTYSFAYTPAIVMKVFHVFPTNFQWIII